LLLPIRTLGDPVLREPAKPVEHFDRTLRRLAKDMTETMYQALIELDPWHRTP